jgi:uncharacterized RDD family membrane protein YckC
MHFRYSVSSRKVPEPGFPRQQQFPRVTERRVDSFGGNGLLSKAGFQDACSAGVPLFRLRPSAPWSLSCLMSSADQQQLDCIVRVVTPENIQFEYLLAGPFQRLPAFVLDFIIRAAVLVILAIGLSLLAGLLRLNESLVFLVLFLTYFVFGWIYGAFLETWFNGRTFGKMLFKLRVISDDGRPINGTQAVLRNVLRTVDLFPVLTLQVFSPEAPPASVLPTCLVALVAMASTSRMQRLGDIVAGTMVVVDRTRGISTNLQPEDVRAFALAEEIPPTFQISRSLARVVGLYMERRKLLNPARRSELAAHVAKPLLPEFRLQPDTSPDLLMCALYVRIYHSEEQRAQRAAASRALMNRALTSQFQPPLAAVVPTIAPPGPPWQVGAPATPATPATPPPNWNSAPPLAPGTGEDHRP